MNLQNALRYADQRRDEQLAQVKDLLTIPSVSAQPEHSEDCQRAARWLADHLARIGLDNAMVLQTQGRPAVYADWLKKPGAPTVLLYGHYDVQPPDPLDEWTTPPFEPSVRDGYLYARGASDDKGQIFGVIKSVEACLHGGGELPLNVKFIIEGEEETGSPSLTPFMQEQKTRLAANVAYITDGSFTRKDLPNICIGARGLVYMEVEVAVAERDMHSGFYGGAARNPVHILADIIAKLKDANGRITVPGFYDKVRTLTAAEKADMAQMPFDVPGFMAASGLIETWGEPGYTVLEQTTARPSLDCNGIIGGYTGPGAKTVLPARAKAKISMRLVADQEPDDIERRFTDYVKQLTPPKVSLTLRKLSGSYPALVDRNHPAMQAASAAYEDAFGARPIFIRGGGTLPIAAEMQRVLGLPLVLTGFGFPDDNIHSPNERYYLDSFYKGIAMTIHFLNRLAQAMG